MQLMAMMEEQSLSQLSPVSVYAADYEDNFPKVYGKKL
jgi:hypothetical protein